MKVYVANTTRQVQDFVWRAIGQKAPRKISIDVGTQQALPGDWNTEDVAYLEEQHRRYGMVRVDEIDRTRDFVGLCFSIDKPIPVDKIRTALTINEQVLMARGVELRKQAAIAVSNAITENNPGSGLTALELSVQEQPKDGGTPQINEGVRVAADGRTGPAPARPEGQGSGRPSRRRAA